MKEPTQILAKAEEYSDYTANNLSEIVNIPSLSGQEKNIIQKLTEILEELNLDEVKTDGFGNLVARVGDGPKKLAFDAHIDTVDTGDRSQWDFDPFCGEIRDGKVLGRGTCDQKGGAASMITAARILKEMDYNGDFSVYFTFTIMEEDCDGLCWNYLIEREKLVPDYAVITEPTNLAVHRGHRGRMEMDLYFKGLSAHGSMPEKGDNAIYKASRATREIEKIAPELEDDEFLGKGTVAVTMIKSDSPSLCAIPDKCQLHLDRRLSWGKTQEEAVEEIKNLVDEDTEVKVPIYKKRSFKGTRFTQDKYFPTWKIEPEHPLVQAGKKTAELVLKKKPSVGKWTFSTNGVAICGKHGIPSIGFGPGYESKAHAPNEEVPISHLVKSAGFYGVLPYLLGEK